MSSSSLLFFAGWGGVEGCLDLKKLWHGPKLFLNFTSLLNTQERDFFLSGRTNKQTHKGKMELKTKGILGKKR